MYAPLRQMEAPFRFPVQQWMKISGVGTVAIGRIESGVVKPGDTVYIVIIFVFNFVLYDCYY